MLSIIHGLVTSFNTLQVEVTSWQQQAADIERKARKVQLDMEETEREQLLVKKRIKHQPMDVKQAMRVRDSLCVPSSAHRCTMHTPGEKHQYTEPAQITRKPSVGRSEHVEAIIVIPMYNYLLSGKGIRRLGGTDSMHIFLISSVLLHQKRGEWVPSSAWLRP